MQQMQQQQAQMPHLLEMMMNSNANPYSSQSPMLVGGTEESRLRAAEAHLKMLRADAEVFEAQLRAAEATLALSNVTTHSINVDTNSVHSHNIRDPHDAEQQKYLREAKMFREGGYANVSPDNDDNDAHVGIAVKRETTPRRRSRKVKTVEENDEPKAITTKTNPPEKKSSTPDSRKKKDATDTASEEHHDLTTYERRHLANGTGAPTSLPSFLPSKLSTSLSGRVEGKFNDDVNASSKGLYRHRNDEVDNSTVNSNKKKTAVEEIADQAKFIEAQAEALFGLSPSNDNIISSKTAGREQNSQKSKWRGSSDNNNRYNSNDGENQLDPGKLRSALKSTKVKDNTKKGEGVKFKTGREILGRNPNIDSLEHEKLRRLEEKEMERRRKFDNEHSRDLQNAAKKSPREKSVLMVGLDRKEAEEMERRKQWERNREEREAKALMTRPDASADLEEYLEEEERKRQEWEHSRQAEEEEASALVDNGRVRKFAAMFSHPETVSKYNKPQSHVMTWKVKEVHKFRQ
eukprot:m.67307 g.67307  ORF g.67307 m.67307 type:complete len:519 (-) comp8214_c0_seq1:23-1579(-)